ncbi:hypothetical protein [Mycobacterium marinum]|nr:hypothetical protein [Mycobacterium marinum]
MALTVGGTSVEKESMVEPGLSPVLPQLQGRLAPTDPVPQCQTS